MRKTISEGGYPLEEETLSKSEHIPSDDNCVEDVSNKNVSDNAESQDAINLEDSNTKRSVKKRQLRKDKKKSKLEGLSRDELLLRYKSMNKKKNIIIGVLGFLLFCFLLTPRENVNSLYDEINTLRSENITLNEKNEELQAKVDEAKPWFDMKEEERQKKEEEERLKKEAEEKKAREEQEKKEKEEKAAREAEEKKGYDTGITYDQLARNPDSYLYKKIKFKGEIIQVVEGEDETQYRLAVGGNYDKVILLSIQKSKIQNNRILDGDWITFYGSSLGTITYESTMGGNITVPAASVDKFDK